MFHYHNGVSQVPQIVQDIDQPVGIAAVKPDRGFVQNIQSSHQARSQRGRQLYALRLATGKSRRQPVQGQVLQSHFVQKTQTLPNLFQNLVRNSCFLLSQLQLPKKCPCLFYGHADHVANVLVIYSDLPRLQPQARAFAVRTKRISAIAADEHSHM